MKMTIRYVWAACLLAGSALTVSAGLIPEDKQLDPAWVESLTERGHALDRGVAGSSKDDTLKYIGMPVGGIGCGQLYIGGDGKLWHWDVFKSNYRREPPDKRGTLVSSFILGGHYAHPVAQGEKYSNSNGADVSQGFLIRTKEGTRTLDRLGFSDIQFRGEYPIGRVTYSEKDYPVKVQLEAFSPFIPLNAKDSAIPATVMSYTVSNTSEEPVDVELGGWLQNATRRRSPAILRRSVMCRATILRRQKRCRNWQQKCARNWATGMWMEPTGLQMHIPET